MGALQGIRCMKRTLGQQEGGRHGEATLQAPGQPLQAHPPPFDESHSADALSLDHLTTTTTTSAIVTSSVSGGILVLVF